MARPYFYAKTSRGNFAWFPAEDKQDGEEHMCGKLKKAVFGKRDAAQARQHKFQDIVPKIGFDVGKVSPRHF